MGTCECENILDSGNELKALDKDVHKDETNKFKENNLNMPPNNNEKNYANNMSNIVSNDTNREGNYMQEVEGVKPLKQRYEKDNSKNDAIFQSDNNNNFLFKNFLDEPPDEFSKYIFDNLNNIRENPESFIPVIEKAKSNIIYDKKGICIYKSSVKVALSKGKPAFDEAIEFLKNLKPMGKLKFNSDLLIPTPDNEEQLKDRKYMNDLINEKVQSGIPIKSFWRDIIKDRETCLILMIVDDTGPNSGKKRNDILDENIQYIGIVSKKIGKTFACYITLC